MGIVILAVLAVLASVLAALLAAGHLHNHLQGEVVIPASVPAPVEEGRPMLTITDYVLDEELRQYRRDVLAEGGHIIRSTISMGGYLVTATYPDVEALEKATVEAVFGG